MRLLAVSKILLVTAGDSLDVFSDANDIALNCLGVQLLPIWTMSAWVTDTRRSTAKLQMTSDNLRKSSSRDETANVNFITTTSYIYCKITTLSLLFNVSGSLQKFHHGEIRPAVKFENSNQ